MSGKYILHSIEGSFKRLQNFDVIGWQLSDVDVEEFTTISNPDHPYPYRMIKSNYY